MKNKGFSWIFIISVLLFLIDVFTTLYNYKHLKWIETNPLFVKTGYIFPIILLNLLFFIVLFKMYAWQKSQHIVRYLVINALVYVNSVRLLALKNNIYWLFNQDKLIETVNLIKSDPIIHQKTIELTQQSILINIFPLILGFIVFLIWCIDHKIEKK